MCTKCAVQCLSKKQECPFCRQYATEYKDLGTLVIVIPDEEEEEDNMGQGWSDVEELDQQEDDEVIVTGWSQVRDGITVYSSFWPTIFQ